MNRSGYKDILHDPKGLVFKPVPVTVSNSRIPFLAEFVFKWFKFKIIKNNISLDAFLVLLKTH